MILNSYAVFHTVEQISFQMLNEIFFVRFIKENIYSIFICIAADYNIS